MSGFNLPPGVNSNMIPGNRPEDLAEEKFWEDVYEALDALGVTIPNSTEDQDWFEQYTNVVRDIAYAAGRADEKYETELEAALEAGERAT